MFRGVLVLAASVLAMLAFGGAALVAAQDANTSASGVNKTTGITSDGCPIVFADVPSGSTFYDYIHCLACEGIISGYACGGAGEPCNGTNDPYFRPNSNVTRGQLSKIVAESAGYNNNPGSQIFEDVQPGSTYYTPVNQLVQFGFINGYDCGGPGEPCSPQMYRYFRPNHPASRGQIAKIVTQARGWNDPVSGQTFEDVPSNHTFYNYIERLYMHSAASGYPCGGAGEPCVPPGNRPYFRPNTNVTRAQLSKIDVIAFFPTCVLR